MPRLINLSLRLFPVQLVVPRDKFYLRIWEKFSGLLTQESFQSQSAKRPKKLSSPLSLLLRKFISFREDLCQHDNQRHFKIKHSSRFYQPDNIFCFMQSGRPCPHGVRTFFKRSGFTLSASSPYLFLPFRLSLSLSTCNYN